MITANRYHDFSAGHRVVGHENKCAYIHGHNYRVTFHCAADQLDVVGRVLDFGVMKTVFCDWLEDNWDHRFLVYAEDPYLDALRAVSPDSIVVVPFNPTAENMAGFLLENLGPRLAGTGVVLVQVVVEETRKCSASASIRI